MSGPIFLPFVTDTVAFPNRLLPARLFTQPANLVLVKKRLTELEAQHARAYERWEHLESIASAS